MNEISIETYAAQAKQFILKDVRHSIIIGIGAFIIIFCIGLLPNNRHLLLGLSIAAFFLLFIMLLKALVDWRRRFYLVEIDGFSLIEKRYARINGTYDYRFTITSSMDTYSLAPSGGCKKSFQNFAGTSFKIVPLFYEGLIGKDQRIVVLFSPTKTLLGCFDATNKFIANS